MALGIAGYTRYYFAYSARDSGKKKKNRTHTHTHTHALQAFVKHGCTYVSSVICFSRDRISSSRFCVCAVE